MHSALKPVMAATILMAVSGTAQAQESTAPEPGITDAYAKISDDFTMHYRMSGSGETAIIFIPGWTMTADVFDHQLAYFQNSEEFTALAYDPRAQGLTTRTTEGHYYEQHGRDLEALIRHLDLDKVILVGWSAGGGDALEYVRLFGSDALAGLVLLDTSPKSRGTDDTTEWIWYGTKDEGDQDDFLKWFSYDVMVDRPAFNQGFAEWMLEEATPQNVEFVSDRSNMTPGSIAALLNTSYWFFDNTDEVKALDGEVPLLYFVRDEDPWKSLAGEWAKENTPTAEVMVLGKHMMFWERHEEFNEMFSNWLDKSVQ